MLSLKALHPVSPGQVGHVGAPTHKTGLHGVYSANAVDERHQRRVDLVLLALSGFFATTTATRGSGNTRNCSRNAGDGITDAASSSTTAAGPFAAAGSATVAARASTFRSAALASLTRLGKGAATLSARASVSSRAASESSASLDSTEFSHLYYLRV